LAPRAFALGVLASSVPNLISALTHTSPARSATSKRAAAAIISRAAAPTRCACYRASDDWIAISAFRALQLQRPIKERFDNALVRALRAANMQLRWKAPDGDLGARRVHRHHVWMMMVDVKVMSGLAERRVGVLHVHGGRPSDPLQKTISPAAFYVTKIQEAPETL
jgi:hypothetical protein